MGFGLRRILVVVFLVVLGIFKGVQCSSSVIQPRMLDGDVVDTLRRFPHHVSIEPVGKYYNDKSSKLCGGSILNKNWIITASSCLEGSDRVNVNLNRLYRNDTSGSFSIVINNDQTNVFLYPTLADDIALLKIPVDLVFSKTLQPIEILDTPVENVKNKLVVLPGFDISTVFHASGHNMLTYAMLELIPQSTCINAYKEGVFDEYLQLCAKGWNNNPNVPCETDYGSGLIINWPRKPKLVGIYTNASYDCDAKTPSIYLNIRKYQNWIDSVIFGN